MREIDFTSAVAEYLRCKAPYLRDLRIHGGGPRFFKIERRVLYRKRDVDAWIDAQVAATNAEYKKKRGRPRKLLPVLLAAQSRS